MELEGYKNIWKETDQLASSNKLTKEELRNLLHRQAHDSISRLLRNVRIEFYSTLAVVLAAIPVYFFLTSWLWKLSLLFTVLLCLLFLFFYYRKMRLLQEASVKNDRLIVTLTNLHRNIRRYLNVYRMTYRVTLPPFMFLGLLIGGQFTSGDHWYEKLYAPVTLMLVLLVLAAAAYLFDWAIAWYLKRLYGSYLDRLSEIIRQLGDSESNDHSV